MANMALLISFGMFAITYIIFVPQIVENYVPLSLFLSRLEDLSTTHHKGFKCPFVNRPFILLVT